jgi:hypothetical protein
MRPSLFVCFLRNAFANFSIPAFFGIVRTTPCRNFTKYAKLVHVLNESHYEIKLGLLFAFREFKCRVFVQTLHEFDQPSSNTRRRDHAVFDFLLNVFGNSFIFEVEQNCVFSAFICFFNGLCATLDGFLNKVHDLRFAEIALRPIFFIQGIRKQKGFLIIGKSDIRKAFYGRWRRSEKTDMAKGSIRIKSG